MKIRNNYAFTLIELIISISIFFILVSATYIPYNHYITKEKVRVSQKIITQSLYEARNMAINWTQSGSNVSIWLYFNKNESNKISFFSYPYTFTGAQITNNLNEDIKLIKEYNLEQNVNITWIDWKENGLFFFQAITWNWDYFYFKPSQNKFENDEIKISFSYNNAEPWSILSWEITYFTKTNIVDY